MKSGTGFRSVALALKGEHNLTSTTLHVNSTRKACVGPRVFADLGSVIRHGERIGVKTDAIRQILGRIVAPTPPLQALTELLTTGTKVGRGAGVGHAKSAVLPQLLVIGARRLAIRNFVTLARTLRIHEMHQVLGGLQETEGTEVVSEQSGDKTGRLPTSSMTRDATNSFLSHGTWT